jgi:hypothetical protein
VEGDRGLGGPVYKRLPLQIKWTGLKKNNNLTKKRRPKDESMALITRNRLYKTIILSRKQKRLRHHK